VDKPTFRYETSDGRVLDDVELLVDIDDIDVDAAEALELAIGADIRAINSLRLTQQLRVFVFISARRVDPGATMEGVGRVKLGPLLTAFTAAVNAKNARGAADGPSAAQQPDLRLVTRPDADPLVSEPGTGAQDGQPAGRDVQFTANLVIPTSVTTPEPAEVTIVGAEPGEVLSPTNAGSED
jgi:hypothetical protein